MPGGHGRDDLPCPICLGQQKGAVEIGCGHTLCGGCLLPLLEEAPSEWKCPECREKIRHAVPSYSVRKCMGDTDSYRETDDRLRRHFSAAAPIPTPTPPAPPPGELRALFHALQTFREETFDVELQAPAAVEEGGGGGGGELVEGNVEKEGMCRRMGTYLTLLVVVGAWLLQSYRTVVEMNNSNSVPQYQNTTTTHQRRQKHNDDTPNHFISWEWAVGKAGKLSEDKTQFFKLAASPAYATAVSNLTCDASTRSVCRWKALLRGAKRSDFGVWSPIEEPGLNNKMRGGKGAYLYHLADNKGMLYGIQEKGDTALSQPLIPQLPEGTNWERAAQLFEIELKYEGEVGTMTALHKDPQSDKVVRQFPPVTGIPSGVKFFWTLASRGGSVTAY